MNEAENQQWTERSISTAPAATSRVPQNEGLFRLLFESSNDAILIRDPVTRDILDCNHAAVVMRGCATKEEVLQTHPRDLSPEFQPDGRHSVEKAVAMTQLAIERGSHSFEWVSRRVNGELFELEITATYVQIIERPLVVMVCRDISRRKRTEEALRESEKKFRLLFEHSGDSILLIDPKTGIVVDCNESAVNISRGRTKEWLQGRHITELAPERQPDGALTVVKARQMIEQVMKGGSYRFEWLGMGPKDEPFPLEVLATAIDLGGKRHMVAVAREITERKKAEARIQQENLELETHVRERTGELVRANEQLKAEIRERRRREKVQQALYQISEAIHTAEDLDSLYRQIHATIQGVMNARNFYIALEDRATGLVHFSYFVDQTDPLPAPAKLTRGPTARVLHGGKPLLVRRLASAPPGEPAPLVDPAGEIFYAEAGSASAVWLGVPLGNRGQVFGVMAVQDYHDDQAYGDEDMRMLTFIGEQTALVIQRKRSEQALRESEQKFRALFEASSQGVMLHDEKEFLEVNPATLRILGYDRPEDLIGKHPAETSAEFQPDGERTDVAARRHIADCMADGSARFDWLCRNSKGEEIPIEVILTRIQMGGRDIIQAVVNDISERKRAEAELIKSLAREKELGQLKGSFVSMVSHEFRTPLGIIMSSAEILEHYHEKLVPEERQEHLQSIHKNTRRMADLMEEVLLLSKTEAGGMEFKPEPLDLENFCKRMIADLSLGADCGNQIHFECLSVPPQVRADEKLLRHVFTNLLMNAVKYSGRESRVLFEVRTAGGEVVCRIQDEGIGIPEPDLQWLFKAFHRGRNVGNLPGTGLGLVIVKRCLELHRGRIEIESAVGKGTTVTVKFPLITA